jgi:hypothetical protein
VPHLIVVTHTPDRLRRTLLGVACQTHTPDSITLTCDAESDAIRAAAQSACDEFDISLTLIMRPRHDLSRAGQARNNAVRHLVSQSIAPDAPLIFFDGDCVPAPTAVADHVAALDRPAPSHAKLVIAWRFEMTPEQTEAFDELSLRAGRPPIEPTPEQWADLRRRHARLARQARLHSLGLTKPHKPKLLGANFSVRPDDYIRVNGHDETYEDWGQEDDDLGRRLYMARVKPVIAVKDILAYHQYHPTRAPRKLAEGRNAHRLEEPCAMRCERGLEHPVDQHLVRVEQLNSQGVSSTP